MGAGIEIDYENSSAPNIPVLEQFLPACRSQHPYDVTGGNPAARLAIDVAATPLNIPIPMPPLRQQSSFVQRQKPPAAGRGLSDGR